MDNFKHYRKRPTR